MRRWFRPALGNSTTIAVNVPATVSGSETLMLNGASLKLWNVTCTGNGEGQWDYQYTSLSSQVRYSVGPETDTLLYESTYGIIAGRSVVGTYTAFEHCTGCGGGWTENYVNTALLTSSNIDFGT
jgi:hypothetical protein